MVWDVVEKLNGISIIEAVIVSVIVGVIMLLLTSLSKQIYKLLQFVFYRIWNMLKVRYKKNVIEILNINYWIKIVFMKIGNKESKEFVISLKYPTGYDYIRNPNVCLDLNCFYVKKSGEKINEAKKINLRNPGREMTEIEIKAWNKYYIKNDQETLEFQAIRWKMENEEYCKKRNEKLIDSVKDRL